MIVVLVFVSGCLFGAVVTGLLMLGPRKIRGRSKSEPGWKVEFLGAPEWYFPPAPEVSR